MDTRQKSEENEIKAASKRGAQEDILHVSLLDDGFDLRYGPNPNVKQKLDENQNA